MGWWWGQHGYSHAETRDSGAERCVLPPALGKGLPEIGCEDPHFGAVSSERGLASRRCGWGVVWAQNGVSPGTAGLKDFCFVCCCVPIT